MTRTANVSNERPPLRRSVRVAKKKKKRSCGSKNVGGGGNVFAPLYHNGGKRHRHRISWDKILKRSMNFKTYRRPPLVRKMLKRNDNSGIYYSIYK